MDMTKAYYSLIQYCPDRGRMETVNVGVVLLCPETGFWESRISTSNARPKKLFHGAFDGKALDSAKQAMRNRISLSKAMSVEAFDRFAATRGNDLLLTSLRPTAVHDPHTDLDRLFRELVENECELVVTASPKDNLKILLAEKVIHRPRLQGLLTIGYEVRFDEIGRSFKSDFAYNNGATNLVRAESFSPKEKSAIDSAERLGAEAFFAQSEPSDDGRRHRVIIVPGAESPGTPVLVKVGKVFQKFDVRVVFPEQLDEFALEIERDIHP